MGDSSVTMLGVRVTNAAAVMVRAAAARAALPVHAEVEAQPEHQRALDPLDAHRAALRVRR